MNKENASSLIALSDSGVSLSEKFSDFGFLLLESLIGEDKVNDLKNCLSFCINEERSYRRRGVDDPSQVAFCPYYDYLFIEILKGSVFSLVDLILGESSILYSYNNSSMLPGKGNFSSYPHVERPYSTGDHLESIGIMILLDDFSIDNGATFFWPGSHRLNRGIVTESDKADFYANAARLQAPRGSVFVFHPRVWHAGGVNTTDVRRDALSLGFCKPYLKQRFDIPSIVSRHPEVMSDPVVKQKMGFSSCPPKTLSEFYSRTGGWSS